MAQRISSRSNRGFPGRGFGGRLALDINSPGKIPRGLAASGGIFLLPTLIFYMLGLLSPLFPGGRSRPGLGPRTLLTDLPPAPGSPAWGCFSSESGAATACSCRAKPQGGLQQ